MKVQAIGRELPDGRITVGSPAYQYANRTEFLEHYRTDARLNDFELRFDEITDSELGRFFQVLTDA